jgi:hypothetical protein
MLERTVPSQHRFTVPSVIPYCKYKKRNASQICMYPSSELRTLMLLEKACFVSEFQKH